MRLKEFNERVRIIDSEKFLEECVDPITYGIKRAMFDQHKYQRLIEVAAATTSSRLAQSRMAKWKRLLERSRQIQSRFERLRAEAQQARSMLAPVPQAPQPQVFELTTNHASMACANQG